MFAITSMRREPDASAASIARSDAHSELVLNTANFLIDLNSSTLRFGTCASSSSLVRPSYEMIVPPLTSARVLFVTSITNGSDCATRSAAILTSTVAPRLSTFEMKMYSMPRPRRSASTPVARSDS
eukprot:Amastigsp_a339769_87.p4 type:complete len:126 gc:universal Amastigsp_a339769_87:511-888(+)